MNVEEFAEEALVKKVREHLKSCLDNIGIEDGYRKDRLLTNLTREICLAFM